MKKKLNMMSLFFLLICVSIPLPHWAENINISKVGELSEDPPPPYYDVAVSGNYAYCLSRYSLDVVNISIPSAPILVSSAPILISSDPLYDYCYELEVYNSRAYIIDSKDLHILDLSTPAAPTLWGTIQLPDEGLSICVTDQYAYIGTQTDETIIIIDISGAEPPSTFTIYNTGWQTYDLHKNGNYLYAAAGDDGIKILDITTPTSPTPVSEISLSYSADKIFAAGNYAYICGHYLGLVIYDISTPQSPSKVGEYSSSEYFHENDYEEMTVHDGLVFLYNDFYKKIGLEILDVSSPANPVLITNYRYPGIYIGAVQTKDSEVYIADKSRGLRILDISNPAAPTRLGGLETWGTTWPIIKSGDYLYMGRTYGLQVVNISSPSAPTHVSFTPTDQVIYTMAKKDSYVYLGTALYLGIGSGNPKLQVYNVSNPANPTRAGEVSISGSHNLIYLEISGNYAYANSYYKFFVFDISNPSSPTQAAWMYSYANCSLAVRGDYIYLLSEDMIKVIDISSPSSPQMVNAVLIDHGGIYFDPADITVKGNYAFVIGSSGNYDFFVYDLSNPESPSLACRLQGYDNMEYIRIDGNNVFLIDDNYEVYVLDISEPVSPQLMGYYYDGDSISKPAVANGCIYVDNFYQHKLEICRYLAVETPPQVSLNRDTLYFSARTTGETSPSQSLWINNAGGGTLQWSVYDFPDWLERSPHSGYGGSQLVLSLDTDYVGYMEPGTYMGTATVNNSVLRPDFQAVAVNLQVYEPSETTAPFGEFSTPTNQAAVSSSVPCTGWALDDVGVDSVKLYLVSGDSATYIGDALLVEGARPDIESLYPTYPQCYKAGWGYMMLTNLLPNGGNGTYTISAVATDMEGKETTLGTKTIYVDNAHAVKPFGAIDSPTQGGTASGSHFSNSGWVLTPSPNTIPTDGSTLGLWVDSVPLGNEAVYSVGRNDIAALFPGYSNSEAAGAYFILDTTSYTNGVHTIYWTATDNAGNADGIGSRYFVIQNSQNRAAAANKSTAGRSMGADNFIRTIDHGPVRIDKDSPVNVKTGYPGNNVSEVLYPDDNGEIFIPIKELERVEIVLGASTKPLSPLPIGASFDTERGILSWIPGLAFVGDHTFAFDVQDASGSVKRKNFRIRILPKF